jgi:hypothetical protein
MFNRDQLEAQFWWAFSCLALTGCKQPEHFHEELVRRCADSYPTEEEVKMIVNEACYVLSAVLNSTLESAGRDRPRLNGWERHLLALSHSRYPD